MKFSMKQILIVISLVGFVGLGTGCQRLQSELQSVQASKEAARFLKDNQAAKAYEASLRGVENESFSATHHLNMGLSLEALGNAENALKAYLNAKKYARADDELFVASFNAGQLLGKAKRVDEALVFYQEALKYKPDSIETKTNIELLIQQEQGGGKGKNDQQQQQQQNSSNNQKQNGNGNDKQDPKDQNQNKDQQGPQGEKQKQYAESPKYVPRQFNGKDLNEADVKKILGELKNQEQKIRAEYNKRDSKESPRGKDW